MRSAYNGCIHDGGFDEISGKENEYRTFKNYCKICGKHIMTNYTWYDEFGNYYKTEYHDSLWKLLNTEKGHKEIILSVLNELNFPIPKTLTK